MDIELEIKFQVPDSERRALSAWLRQKSGHAQRLQARYFDTPDRVLARSGIALRLRKEGTRWVQTLKTASHGGALARGEHNVPLPRSQRPPTLDLERHRRSPGWKRLGRALRKAAPLQSLYATDVRRLSARERYQQAVIDVALDTGAISAAGTQAADAPLVLKVSELELELVAGPRQDLFAAARQCLVEHVLWLDVRSKSLRGDSMANGSCIMPAPRAAPISFDRPPTVPGLMHAVLCECVRHLSLAMSQVAAVDGHQPDHIHQLRVALRRLRSALKLFGTSLPEPWQAWDSQARMLGQRLGGTRDLDVMAASLWPALRDAGAPLVELPAPAETSYPADAVRDRAVQLWLLDLLSLQAMDAPPAQGPSWRKLLPLLDRWHARCRRGARGFAQLDDTQRHALRKRLKRLRYASEFVADLCPPARRERFAKRLAKVLAALGTDHDLRVALDHYREAARTQAEALFAVGWLMARLPASEADCARALTKFARSAPPWTRA